MIFLIGGGDIGRANTNYNIKEIDQEIVKSTNKIEPNFLFIGLADSYADSYYNIIKKNYQNLGCQTAYLKKKNIINNKELAKEKINAADIIYIGGGDTIKLTKIVKEYKIDELLLKAYQKGTILVGFSAGAILLAKGGYSDALILRKESNEYTYLKGLNFVNININPHHNDDPNKTKSLKKYLKSSNKEFYGLENQTALKIENDDISIIKSNKDKNVFYLSYKERLISKKIN